MKRFGCESLCLSCVRLIEDGALRFCHVAHEEETPRNTCHLISIRRFRCVHVSTEVHRSILISTVITRQING